MKKLFFYAALLVGLASKAQKLPTDSIIERMELIMEIIPDPLDKTDSVARITCKLTLSDSVSADKISLKMGTKEGLGDKFSYTFNYNPLLNKNLPAKTAFKKKSNVIWLVLGEFKPQRFYYEAVVENKQAKKSKPFKRY